MKDFLARDCWEYRTQNARKYGRVSKLHGLFGVSHEFSSRIPLSTSIIVLSTGKVGSGLGPEGTARCLHQRPRVLSRAPFVRTPYCFRGSHCLNFIYRSMQILLGPGLLAVEGRRTSCASHALLTILGEQHKRQRKMLAPVFSIKHIRDMMPLFYPVTRKVWNTMLVASTAVSHLI